MPHYRVTLNYNIRAHRNAVIRADTAEDALNEGLKLNDWGPINTVSQDLLEADAEEPTFWIEPCDKDGNKIETDEELKDEYLHPGGYIYYNPLLFFTRQIANFTRYSDDPDDDGLLTDTADAVDTLNRIIREAREILRLPTPSAEEAKRAQNGL